MSVGENMNTSMANNFDDRRIQKTSKVRAKGYAWSAERPLWGLEQQKRAPQSVGKRINENVGGNMNNKYAQKRPFKDPKRHVLYVVCPLSERKEHLPAPLSADVNIRNDLIVKKFLWKKYAYDVVKHFLLKIHRFGSALIVSKEYMTQVRSAVLFVARLLMSSKEPPEKHVLKNVTALYDDKVVSIKPPILLPRRKVDL